MGCYWNLINYLPSADYVYVEGLATVRLPDGAVITGSAADPEVSPDGKELSWDFTSVVGEGGVSHLLISEVMYYPPNSGNFDENIFYQWVELFNPTLAPVTMDGWYFKDASPGQTDPIPTITIDPGEFVIIAANTDCFLENYPGFAGQLVQVTDSLSNGICNGLNYFADGIALMDSDDNVVDAMSYGGATNFLNPPAPLVAQGYSLERRPANQDRGIAGDWVARAVPEPGAGVIQSGLNNGDAISVLYYLYVSCAAEPGNLTATAFYQQPPDSGPAQTSESTLLNPRSAVLVVSKTPMLQSRKYKEEFTWELTVKNEGFGHAANVRLRDSLGPGIEFVSFDIAPTNAVIGSSVEWDASVIPELESLAPGEAVTVQITARCIACSGLYNDGDACWGCLDERVDGDEVCYNTADIAGTARATIDFISEPPILAGSMGPASPMAVPYCSGAELTFHVTNAVGAGPAQNVTLIVDLPDDFAIEGDSVFDGNKIDLGNLEPGSETDVTVTLKADNSSASLEPHNLYVRSSYEDICAKPFSALAFFGSFQLTDLPGATIHKVMPENLSVGDTPTSIKVRIYFAYSNFDNTAVTFQDIYPQYPDGLLSIANVTPAATDDGSSLTWEMILSGDGVVEVSFDLVGAADCDKPASQLFNTVAASPFVDCLGGVRDVAGNGQQYPFWLYPRDCNPDPDPDCFYSSNKEFGPAIAEACRGVVITQVFKFTGDFADADWSGSFFRSDLGGQGGSTDDGRVQVIAHETDVTGLLNISQTWPNLIIALDGLTGTAYDSPSKLDGATKGLQIIYPVAHTNVGWVYENSWLPGTGCGGAAMRTSWLQGESRLGLSMSAITNNSACGISTVTVSFTNLPSPQIVGAPDAVFPAYDLLLSIDLDADGDGNFSYAYVPLSTVFEDLLDANDDAIASAEPSISGSILSWDIGSIATNGAGRVSFALRASCSAFPDERHTAWVGYNSWCESGTSPQTKSAETAAMPIPPLFDAALQVALQPEFTFLVSTQYVTRIEVINAGAGVAYNVHPEMVLPACVLFGSASVAPTNIGMDKVQWGAFPDALGDLQDLDGDGVFNDLPPNGRFEIWVTNYIESCGARSIQAHAAHGCKDEDCEVSDDASAEFMTANGQIVTGLKFPTTLYLCENGEAQYELRNAGIVDLMDVSASVVLPNGITYIPNSSMYSVDGDAPIAIVGDPSGDGSAGSPLTWDSSLIPELAKMQPMQTITIVFGFPIECEASTCDGVFGLAARYTDICDETFVSKQVKVSADIKKPELAVNVQAGPVGGPHASGLIVRDLHDQFQYRVFVEHKVVSQADASSVLLEFVLPDNVDIDAVTPVPSSQTGSTLSWDSAALLGGAPYEVGDAPIQALITVSVNNCEPDTAAQAKVDYGCVNDMCLSVSGSHTLRTKPVSVLTPKMSLALKTCGGAFTVHLQNNGATAKEIVLNATAPDGYLFTSAAVSGHFTGDPVDIVLGGLPSGKTATLDLDTAFSGNLTLPFEKSFTVVYELISDGENLDYTANPLDINYTDPDPPMPSEVTASCQVTYKSLCDDVASVSDSAKTYPDMPDPDLDLQPNCAVVSQGDEQTFTLTLRNNAQRGNAENLHVRLRFGGAWINVTEQSITIDQSGSGSSGTAVCEIDNVTNVLISLPGVVLDPISDNVVMVFKAEVGGSSGTLDVLAEVVGDCADARISAVLAFTNTLGETALADTMEGSSIHPVNGRYYGFDQDRSSFIANGLFKTVRYPSELQNDAGDTRNARIGEPVIFQIEATFFGSVFSNISITDSLPQGCVFDPPKNAVYSGNITGADYDPNTGAFTIQPDVLDATTFSSFYVEIPARAANVAVNQDGYVVTNEAAVAYDVLGFTNETPKAEAFLPILEPDLQVEKAGTTNLLRSGEIVWFTNVVSHTSLSSTNAYNILFQDTLPAGLTFRGVDLTTDGVDNNGNGVTDEAGEGSLIQGDERTIIIPFGDHPNLVDLPLDQTRTFIFPAVVSNQFIGSTMTNNAHISWMSLSDQLNDERRTGAGNINDYTNVGSFKLKSLPLGEVAKEFVSSSQANTLDANNTNDLAIGERIIYELRVDVPDGVISNLVITEKPPAGMDFVGANPSMDLTWPGFGYQFIVPAGGLIIPTTAAEGLLVDDKDPTPLHSTTTDGSAREVTFTFPPFTNAVDGNPNNDYFKLRMEFVILDQAINNGTGASPRTNRNVIQVSDAFRTTAATGPVYRVVEPDIKVSKTLTPETGDAFDVVTIYLVVSNHHNALSEAYHVAVTDVLDAVVFDGDSISTEPPPDGWKVEINNHVSGKEYVFSAIGDVGLAPSACVTGIFHVALAESVAPGKTYQNIAQVQADGLYDAPPAGIKTRVDGDDDSANITIHDMAFTKAFHAKSEATTPPDASGQNVQIGEVVTYALTATLPDGTTEDLTFHDVLPQDMAFVVGSVEVDDSLFEGDLASTINTTPSAGTLGNPGAPVTVVLQGSTITRANGDSSKNKLTLRLKAVVLDTEDVSGLAPQTTLENSATLTYSGNPKPTLVSPTVEVTVVEPKLGLVKTLSKDKVDAGDDVEVKLVLSNTGTAAAYDVEIADALPANWFEPGSVEAVSIPTGFILTEESNVAYIRSDTSAAPDKRVVLPSGSVEFTFKVKIAGAAAPNERITNTAVARADTVFGPDIYDAQRKSSVTSSAVMTNNDFAITKNIYASSEHTSPPDSLGNYAQVGEIFTYQLEVKLPESTIADLEFTDNIPAGMAFVVGSLQVDASSLNGTLGSPVTVTPSAGLLGADGQDVKIVFEGSTVVTPDNNPATDILRLRYNAVVLNKLGTTGLPPAPSQFVNAANVTYKDNPSVPVTADGVGVEVIEPAISLAKQVSPTLIDAGDEVAVTLTLSNTGTAAAYGIDLQDPLSTWYMNSATVQAVSIPSGYELSVDGDVVRIQSKPGATLPGSAVQPNESVVFVFKVRAGQNLPPNAVFINEATLKARSVHNKNTAGQEREYTSDAEFELRSKDLAISKRIIDSTEKGEMDATTTDAQLGEILTFELMALLPEGTIKDLAFTENIPTGMAYVAGSVELVTTNFAGTAPGTITVNPNTAPLCEPGEPVTFTLEGDTVVLADNDPNNNLLRLRVGVLVTDHNALTGLGEQSIVTNSASLTFKDNPEDPVDSGDVEITIIEPELTLKKTFDVAQGDAGDWVTTTLKVSNSGSGPAFNVAVTDQVFEAYFDLATIEEVTPSLTGWLFDVATESDYAIVQYKADPAASAPDNVIAASGSRSFVFRARLSQAVTPGLLVENTAVIDQADTVQNTTPFGNGRDKSGPHDDASLNVPNLNISKILFDTSEKGPSDTTGMDVTIGEEAIYQIAVTLPEGTIHDLVVEDATPLGMAYVLSSAQVPTVTNMTLPTGTPDVSGGLSGQPLVFAFPGDIVVEGDNDPSNNKLVIRFAMRVLDVAANDGLPVEAGGSGPVERLNTATVTFDAKPVVDTSEEVKVRVVEPCLNLWKTMGPPSNNWVKVGLGIKNIGLSAAFDVALEDYFPTSLWDTATIAPVDVPDGFEWDAEDVSTGVVLRVFSDPAFPPPTNCVAVDQTVWFYFQARLLDDLEVSVSNVVAITNYTTLSGDSPYERKEPDKAVTNELGMVPGVAVFKWVETPFGRSLEVGEDVTFAILATNTGPLELTTVRVEDFYPTRELEFVSAVPAVDFSEEGHVVWENIGPIDAYDALGLSITFKVLAATYPEETTNTVGIQAIDANDLPVPSKTNATQITILDPLFRLQKELISPVDRPADLGETALFRISVTNNGDSRLETIDLEDTYDESVLEFLDATPDYVLGQGSVSWANIGPLDPGEYVAVTGEWRAIMGTLPDHTINSVVAGAVTEFGLVLPPLTSSAPVEIATPDYVLQKTQVHPLNRLAVVGEVIAFQLAVSNNGQVALGPLDVYDVFPTNWLSFVSALPAHTWLDADAGLVSWSNLGYLAVGEVCVITARFEAISATMPDSEINSLIVAGLTTSNNLPAPDKTYEHLFQVEAPSAIGGIVWNDLELDGIMAAGEPQLANITVTLHDAEGNVIATTVTDADGAYMFSALPAGSYRICFMPPDSYTYTCRHAGADDAVNSKAFETGWVNPVPLAVGETNRSIHAGLFEYVSLYGKAWNDRNANGIREPDEPFIDGIVFSLFTNGAAIASCTSTHDGAYAFTHLPPGSYYVRAIPPSNHVVSVKHAASDEALDNDFDPETFRSDSYTLLFGQTATNIDLGVYLPTAEISLNKSVDLPAVELNGEVVFSVLVSNKGPNKATGLVVRDMLPDNLKYKDHVGGEYNSVSGDWVIPELAPGSATNLWVTTAITRIGCFTNTVFVLELAELNPAKDDNTAHAVACATNEACLTTLTIQVEPEKAEWSLSAPAGYNGPIEGVGSFGPVQAPTGTYCITYKKLPAYRPPQEETIHLELCDELSLLGHYIRLCCVQDFDGDGATDLALYNEETGTWYVLNPLTGEVILWALPWGGPGMIPVRGDFDGDGITDISVYMPAPDPYSRGAWYVMRPDGTLLAFDLEWGCYGYEPIVGDFDGDGACDFGVYDNNTGSWYVRSLEGDYLIWDQAFGGPGFKPLRGDFDGDGKTDLAVFEQATAAWYAATREGDILLWNEPWGVPHWTPVPADYNGNNVWDLAVYDQELGGWFIKDHSCDCLLAWNQVWGGSGFVPVMGDYDGDGSYDLAVYQEQTGLWYAMSLSGRIIFWGMPWGGPGFQPVP